MRFWATWSVVLSLFIQPASVFADPSISEGCTESYSFEQKSEIEKIRGEPIPVQRLSTHRSPQDKNHPGISIKKLFGDEPQIIIGTDTGNSGQPYLIIGGTRILVTSSRVEVDYPLMYNAALKMSVPTRVETEIYQLGKTDATVVRPGYFVRLKGIPASEIKRIESTINVHHQFDWESSSWTGMIDNLTAGLKEISGAQLDCKDTSCESLYRFLDKSITHGFVDQSGRKLEVEFYTVDEKSLAHGFMVAKVRNAIAKTGIGLLYFTLGTIGAGTVAITYDMIAELNHWPKIPIPFMPFM